MSIVITILVRKWYHSNKHVGIMTGEQLALIWDEQITSMSPCVFVWLFRPTNKNTVNLVIEGVTTPCLKKRPTFDLL